MYAVPTESELIKPFTPSMEAEVEEWLTRAALLAEHDARQLGCTVRSRNMEYLLMSAC